MLAGGSSGSTPDGVNALTPTRRRDVRLDFFRGLGMFIILIAHIPGNFLTLWIPARFGFSDATEIFVFCSGMASAIAFGRVFDEKGLAMGTARILYRAWQVYWAHIALFLAVATAMAMADQSGYFGDRSYIGSLNLFPFFRDTIPNLIGLMTLTYVPNYFDILPMYVAILLMIPVVMALARIHPAAAMATLLLVWALAGMHVLRLPAEPWSDRAWFFNPFAWQIIFFTGFAFMRGWLPAPPRSALLIAIALAYVLLTLPIAHFRFYRAIPWIMEFRGEIRPWIEKTEIGLFRYIHFLAVAYLAWIVVGPGGNRLLVPDARQKVVNVFCKVGQQALAVFVVSMFSARILDIVLDEIGRSLIKTTIINLIGMAIIIATAYGMSWLKSNPWKISAPKPPPERPDKHDDRGKNRERPVEAGVRADGKTSGTAPVGT